jgi:lipoprotein-releasing system ATP-binding protein
VTALIEAKGLTRTLNETVPVTLVSDVTVAIAEHEFVR